jgi:hypothetical protein
VELGSGSRNSEIVPQTANPVPLRPLLSYVVITANGKSVGRRWDVLFFDAFVAHNTGFSRHEARVSCMCVTT